MATIVEIAKLAEVSPSTASIVLSGNAEDRKISVSTQSKVLEAAKKLGYTPNIMARRLRAKKDSSYLITSYQSIDARSMTMIRFSKGLYSSVHAKHNTIILNLMHYATGHLNLERSLHSADTCNGAIICNSSMMDLDFLKNYKIPFPAVIYNSICDGYSSVTIDDKALGNAAAEILYKNNCRKVSYISNQIPYYSNLTRLDSFTRTCETLGMDFQNTYQADATMGAGYQLAEKFLYEAPLPEGLFFANEVQAFGAIKKFREAGIRIPDDLRIIAIGNGTKELSDFSEPKISTFHLPLEDMASTCLDILLKTINGELDTPQNHILPYKYIAKESCGT